MQQGSRQPSSADAIRLFSGCKLTTSAAYLGRSNLATAELIESNIGGSSQPPSLPRFSISLPLLAISVLASISLFFAHCHLAPALNAGSVPVSPYRDDESPPLSLARQARSLP